MGALRTASILNGIGFAGDYLSVSDGQTETRDHLFHILRVREVKRIVLNYYSIYFSPYCLLFFQFFVRAHEKRSRIRERKAKTNLLIGVCFPED